MTTETEKQIGWFEGPKRITEELKSVGELGSYSLRAWGIRLGFRKAIM